MFQVFQTYVKGHGIGHLFKLMVPSEMAGLAKRNSYTYGKKLMANVIVFDDKTDGQTRRQIDGHID